MTHRERVLAALHHKEADRVPLFYRDVPEVEQRLLRDLNLKNREELLQFFDVDFRWVGPAYIGPPLFDEKSGRRRDIWGVESQYVPFNDRAGYWEITNYPLADADNPSALDAYPWPSIDWFDFSMLADQAKRVNDYAIMTSPGFASPGLLQHPIQALVGTEKSLIDLAINPEFFHALVEHVLDFLKPFVDRMLGAAGDRIDFFRLGDDYGTQNGLMLSPQHWREFIRPGLQQLGDIARRHGAHVYLHSCGSVRKLIPDLIEIGVDVLDPLQVKADGMLPAELKAEFGDAICFSGGVDEQELLPKGTPEEIKAGVQQLLEVMAPGGGFFIGPTHNFQDDICTENIAAMYQAAKQWKY